MFPTRLIVHGDVLAVFIASWRKLMDFWDWSFQATSDTEMEVRLQAAVSTFQFLFKESYVILYYQSSNDSFYYDDPKKVNRELYFEIIYNIINCIRDRFSQKNYQIYVHLQEIFVKAFKE